MIQNYNQQYLSIIQNIYNKFITTFKRRNPGTQIYLSKLTLDSDLNYDESHFA